MSTQNNVAETPGGAARRDPNPDRRDLRRVVAASMAGTVVEWYEFFLYASAAALVFNKTFFPPGTSEIDGFIQIMLTYAVGFVARPLGGIVFGHFGDRFGRKHLLQVSIILVGIATFLMGCLPDFATIGYAAPILLVVLRFLQGFAVGGEWGGAVLLVAEHAPNARRGFWAAWPQAAVPGGNLVATLVLWILSTTLTSAQFLGWGWRIAFWLSAVIVVIGYYIRTRITDAPIFQEVQNEVEESQAQSYGVAEVFRRYPKGVFGAMGLRLAENIMYYLVVTFSLFYLTQLKVNTAEILGLMFIAHAIHFLTVPVWGGLTDRVGRRPVYAVGAVLSATWGFFAFPMFDTRSTVVILAAIVIGLLFHGMMYAGQPAIMAEMFPTRMRYSGVSLGYQVTSVIAGSLAPTIGASLLKDFHSSVPVAIYLAIACVITLAAVAWIKETTGISLHDVDDEDRQRLLTEKGTV
ncbi:MFS transporter [Tersicoccus sp. Bi-70]|uniref:MFS transporter n=1 Tax=Tersicoccus sp. Bi-70 TaxID=1897634 RepID=UPI0009FB34C5|nr:MFS transporter [Tersicoccus sp. Bi-70]